MAIKVNKALTAKSGLNVPTGSLIALDTVFKRPQPVKDGDGNITPKRIVEFGLSHFATKQDYLDNSSPIRVKEIRSNYKKEMTDQEFQAVLSNGSVAQVWLKEMIEDEEGIDDGDCEVIDPFV